MQAVLYYFSATGNSLYAAKRIAEKIGECNLVSIPATREEPMITPAADTIGLIFPMHYFGVPPLVKQFIAKLDLSKVSYIFAVVTCGSPVMSSAMHELKKLLKTKKSTLHAGFYVSMVSSYIPMFPMPNQKIRQKRLGKADKKLDRITELVKSREPRMAKEYLWPVCRPIYSYWINRFDKIDRKFSNSDQCTSCGQCVKVCPVGNIKLAGGRPVWQHRCQECLACLHICPVHSIEFGRSKGKERYHHPQISWQEIIAAQGKNF